MNSANPIWERELRIPDDGRTKLRRQIDPMIHDALMSRGYIETKASNGRIPLDSRAVLPSTAFVDTLKSQIFDALDVSSTTHVYDNERTLFGAEINLYQIGGFVSGRLIALGNKYLGGVSMDRSTPKEEIETKGIDRNQFDNIIEDIRGHTQLGYNQLDSAAPFENTIGEIGRLSPILNIDRKLRLEGLTDTHHGEISYKIGESLVDKQVRRSQNRRRQVSGRMFEVASSQPVNEGTVYSSLLYRSARHRTAMKLTVAIDGTDFTDSEKEELYQEEIRSFQDDRYTRFGDATIRNLENISDSDSATLRVS